VSRIYRFDRETAFTIESDGRVSEVQMAKPKSRNSWVDVCIVDMVENLRFAPPCGGGKMTVKRRLRRIRR
jgi:outer membrane biosynthesis protein TonB